MNQDALNKAAARVLREYQDAIACGRPIPDYLQQQADALYAIEGGDPAKGLKQLIKGIRAEAKQLKELSRGKNL